MSHRLGTNRRNPESRQIFPKQQQRNEPIMEQSNQNRSQQSNEINYHTNQTSQATNVPRPNHPSVNAVHEHDKEAFRKGNRPFPPADSLFRCDNTYDANLDFIRPTSAYCQFANKKYNFPLGAWITPMGSNQIHEVKLNTPMRCNRCKGYINPYFKQQANNIVNCNLCGMRFQLPENLDKANVYSAQISTEGAIDFIVNDKVYMRKSMKVIKNIFLIQVTLHMIETGMLSSIIQGIKSAIQSGEFQPNIRFGVAYFSDLGVTFLKYRSSKAQQSQQQHELEPIQYIVNTRTGGYCCPLSDKQFLYNPNDQKQKERFLRILDKIYQRAETAYQNGKYCPTANYFTALHCIKDSFQNQTGRIMLFTQLEPRSVPGAIGMRSNQLQLKPLTPLNNEYYTFAQQLLKQRIGVDHFIFSKQNATPHQISTTHFISTLTGGKIYPYLHYNPENNSQHLYYSLYRAITKQVFYDIDFTCRVSNGLSINEYLVGDGSKQVRDIGLSMMDSSYSFGITFIHEQKIQDSFSYLQFAMMYTNGKGQRKIRVINYKFQNIQKIDAIHQGCDYLTVAKILIHQFISKLKNGEPIKIRQQFVQKLATIIAQFKQQSNFSSNFNSLACHPNFSCGLAYIHSVINSRLFLNAMKMQGDQKMIQILKLSTYNFYSFALKLYPHLYSLKTDIYDVEEGQPIPGDFLENDQQIAILPPNLPLTKNSMEEDGIYLINNGQYLYIVVMHHANNELLMDLFGSDDFQKIEEEGLPQLETSHNIRVNNMINQLRRRNTQYNGIYLPLIIRTPLRKGPFSELIYSFLKQDYNEMNYFSFLDGLHRTVQTKQK